MNTPASPLHVVLLPALLLAALVAPHSQTEARADAGGDPSPVLRVEGNRFLLNGKPFDMWGVRTASAAKNRRTTDHLIAQLDDYVRHGVNTITVFYQGSSGGNHDPFSPDGTSIDAAHQDPWTQRGPIRYDLAGDGTRERPGIRWYFAAVQEAAANDQKPTGHAITVSGTRFLLNGNPFPYTGVSFFNAIYNPSFNKSSEERKQWLRKFKRYGINVLRVWCQWDNNRGFVDAGAGKTMYGPEGTLRGEHLKTLKEILRDADAEGVVVELALFSRESWREDVRLSDEAMDKAVESMAKELLPHRNLTFQVWNEFDHRVLEAHAIIKRVDPKRLVTNSPGYAGDMGKDEQNKVLDYLTPHTTRQGGAPDGKTWLVAPREIGSLIEKYRKPVVDDEPARNGTTQFGGPRERTHPQDHVVHTLEIWKAGGYATYHHDMFQLGYGSPSVPPSGVPDPEFSPYHRVVFEFLALRERYMPEAFTKP